MEIREGSLFAPALIAIAAAFFVLPLAALIFIVLLIARFYQNFSGERTYFSLYLVPLVFFMAVSLFHLSSSDKGNVERGTHQCLRKSFV